MFKAAFFDLDGVVLNTEWQYTRLWKNIGRKFLPGIEHFEQRIKGMTLIQIFDQFFPGDEKTQYAITTSLNDFEKHMSYDYIKGFEDFVNILRDDDILTAVVTSSNKEKMNNVYKAHPDFRSQFDAILTSEDFEKSKPDPDCYQKAAQLFGLQHDDCVGFEDSINGLKSVKSAGMFCVGLATTNPKNIVAGYADMVIDDYVGITPDEIKANMKQQ